MAALTIEVKARTRNAFAVKLGVKAIALIARWLKPETMQAWMNALLSHLYTEVQVAGGKWQRVTGVQLEAKIEETAPVDGWRTFRATGERTITLQTRRGAV